MLHKFLAVMSLLFGYSITGSSPDLAIIQAAYQREAASGSPLHDAGLRIIEAACDKDLDRDFVCQVTYLSADDPQQRLYFDVVSVRQEVGGWALKSGLCKH